MREVGKNKPVTTEILNIEQLEKELEREKVKVSNRALITGLLCALTAVIVFVLVVVNLFPVYRVHGSSMEPTISAGDIVVCTKNSRYSVGDIVAIEYEGKILIKRLIAEGNDWVEIDENGTLSINGEIKNEPYAVNGEAGENIAVLPMQVPKGEWYIMGDNRIISGDSRLSEIGTVSDDQIIGRVTFRILPIGKTGKVG